MSRTAAFRIADKVLQRSRELDAIEAATQIARIEALMAPDGNEWRAYLQSLDSTLEFLSIR